jgi:hypothetical protein
VEFKAWEDVIRDLPHLIEAGMLKNVLEVRVREIEP